MKKITFLMPQLGGGGAERVVSTVIRHLDPRHYSIDLILVHNKGNYLKNLPDSVNIIPLKSPRTRYVYFELLKVIRKTKPDILFSTLRGLSLLLLLMKPFLPSNTKIVIREENTVSVALKESNFQKFWEIHYRTLFKKADIIICQSDYMKDDLEKNYGVTGKHVKRIYNPVDFDLIEEKYNQSVNPFPNDTKKNVVVIGRLAYQKGIDILLKSIKKSKSKMYNTNIWIIGNGTEERNYKNMAIEYGLQDIVKFKDSVENPFQWMKFSDLYLLPSRYEGLPNVLLEAATCGCNIIVTDHPGGTKEIMQIIDKEESIVENLSWDNHWFEQTTGVNHKNLKDNFSVNTIIDKYEIIFEELLGEIN